ncbi:winged helix-turn-helix domain-containing protein [candidate division TA06 bacterium]|uniref:Winged helix-turn-helix domain-containing protein n=1 Tax=candidate division TA06 bacterium TaxID=2250710 RepID=A0A933I9X3_UNCT6|nr:winged helix-turn-helix domain-containing protein [candidate division TA06 bacterium]
MWIPTIGENAGKIWKTLDQKGPSNIAALKKAAKLDDKSLYFALGWLAREDKIAFTRDKRQILISLK